MKIFGPKREELMGGWRRLQNKELHGLHPSPIAITVIKSRRIRWAEIHIKFWSGNLKGRHHSEDLGIDGG